jgi:anthranilate phosphoribosyltransferase
MTDPKDILKVVVEGKDLSAEQARGFLEAVIKGEMRPAQVGAVLTALRMKGESSREILGLLQTMRAHVLSVEAPGAIDIVGTGGDGSGTFNVSTTSAFVAAGAGARIAKHGSRSASSKCGSADVLETLGVNINLSKEEATTVYRKAGIVFLFAPLYHPALKEVVVIRKELGIRTIFNVLGPFANPAGTTRQLTGVANKDLAKKMAEAAKSLGYSYSLIVSSEDGMDEISLFAPTRAYEVRGTSLRTLTINPTKFGFKKATKEDVLGGTAEENAGIIREVLAGKKGAKRDIVVLNTAFALVVAGIAKTPKEGVVLAEKSLDSGKARAALQMLVQESSRFKKGV